jgi:hypothetical protein
MLSVIFTFLPLFQGSETNQTDRFAADLLHATLIEMLAVPERCTER